MSIKESTSIPVYNYNEFYVYVPTNIMTHRLEPAHNGVPSVDYFTSGELVYINGITDCFRTGYLMFDEQQSEEIYTEILKFSDWKNILTNKRIETNLLNPTIDGLQELIDIRSQSVFDRVKTIFTRLKNSDTDISNRVMRIIDVKSQEMKKGIVNSKIELRPKDIDEIPVSTNEAKEIKEQNAMLLKQIEEMKKVLSQMQMSQNNPVAEVADKSNETENVMSEKKVGRKPKKS